VCEAIGTQAFVALWEDGCIVSFKGTNNPVDAFRDLEAWHEVLPWDSCPGCNVHAGFLSTYMALRGCVMKSLRENGCREGSPIKTTGHSLGAAASALAMVDLSHSGWIVEESYDFGRPRVGDEVFARTFNARFSAKSWRITHKLDPIPMLPFHVIDLNWTHTEPEFHYKGDVLDGYEMCTDPDDHTHCIEQYTPSAIHILDHVHYMDVRIGTSGCKWFSESLPMNSQISI
jgi:predicted lipase